MKNSVPRTLLCLALLTGFSACSKKADHDHAEHHHTHVAPHGGTLVGIGEHQFNLELVRDASAGTLTGYLLGAHAENFVRVPLPAITLVASLNGQPQPLVLTAVANSATGETIGDTSQFTAQADWLKATATFDATIPTLDIHGAKFTDVKFNFPKGTIEPTP